MSVDTTTEALAGTRPNSATVRDPLAAHLITPQNSTRSAASRACFGVTGPVKTVPGVVEIILTERLLQQ
jgi:hypothetical protein